MTRMMRSISCECGCGYPTRMPNGLVRGHKRPTQPTEPTKADLENSDISGMSDSPDLSA